VRMIVRHAHHKTTLTFCRLHNEKRLKTGFLSNINNAFDARNDYMHAKGNRR